MAHGMFYALSMCQNSFYAIGIGTVAVILVIVAIVVANEGKKTKAKAA
jgi:hypothetical protein